MYFMGIDGAKFRRPVTPGDQLRFELTLLKLKSRICKMRGEALRGRPAGRRGGAPVARSWTK